MNKVLRNPVEKLVLGNPVKKSVFIRAVIPSAEIRKKYCISAGRAVIWESKNKTIKPVLCHIGQEFEDHGYRFKIVDDERFPSVINKAVEIAKRGYPLELGLNL